MSRGMLLSGSDQPFVRLGTIPDMTGVARKLAMIREAAIEIKRLEKELPDQADWDQFKRKQEEMAMAADQAEKWTNDVIHILQGTKRNVEGFLRGL